jgi:hypothetical protein
VLRAGSSELECGHEVRAPSTIGTWLRAFTWGDRFMRLSELAGLAVDALDMETDVAHVLGQGRRPHGCPFDAKAASARPVSPGPREAPPSFEQALWLGEALAMTSR